MSLASITQNHLDPLLLFSKFSKFSLCKFGPDLPNLVKFISTLLQKFHQNSGSLLEQREATPPKISSRKNHQRPFSFGRTPCGHCYCSKFRNSVSVSSSVSTVSVTRPQCTWHVARGLACLSEASHAHLARPWRRWRPGPPSPACLAAAGSP